MRRLTPLSCLYIKYEAAASRQLAYSSLKIGNIGETASPALYLLGVAVSMRLPGNRSILQEVTAPSQEITYCALHTQYVYYESFLAG